MNFRTCPCGKTSQNGRCGTSPICANVCGRLLDCKNHTCQETCHKGACRGCAIQVTQTCDCREPTEKIVDCTEGVQPNFSCGKKCQKQLACGNHFCSKICHDLSEPCEICPRSPELVKTCFCGKQEVQLRKTCTDEIPSCGAVCENVLNCGPVGNNHVCKQTCHEGPCPKCPLTTEVTLQSTLGTPTIIVYTSEFLVFNFKQN